MTLDWAGIQNTRLRTWTWGQTALDSKKDLCLLEPSNFGPVTFSEGQFSYFKSDEIIDTHFSIAVRGKDNVYKVPETIPAT